VAVQDSVSSAGVAGASAGGAQWRAIALSAYPFIVVGAIWEIIARAGIFPHKLFPTLEDIARSFVDLTISGILPHHVIDTLIPA